MFRGTLVVNGSILNVIVVNPTNNYLFKVKDPNTRKRCEMCPRLRATTKARLWYRCFPVDIAKFLRAPIL